MAKLNLEKLRKHIQGFEFQALFNELGWSNPTTLKTTTLTINATELNYSQIAQLSGVVILEITAIDNSMPDAKTRIAVHEKIATLHHENVLIFVDKQRTQSCWFWMKREGVKHYPRNHFYFKGQSGELLLSKLSAMNVDFSELDDDGNIAIIEVAQRLKASLDIEPITKKFFKEFEQKHNDFVEQILGIANEKDRAWYASVLLHRLMFIWFLQKKGFLDKGELDYLNKKFTVIRETHGEDNYYQAFLTPLFFQGFAKPENERSADINKLLGKIRYLNGGLFLPHVIEERYSAIQVNDKAFSDLFALFNGYSWNLNDTIGGADNEINPDVLGYIFEKYINQKAFGAYYTRPEITDYLCERTISKLIIDRVNYFIGIDCVIDADCGREFIRADSLDADGCANKFAPTSFTTLPELLFKLDAPLCRILLFDILPSLSLLDPACGSGAFLVAAMKTLIAIYSAIIGRIKFIHDEGLTKWLKETETAHSSIEYFIKKRIITDNLYGVDIMQEATEIAKLRLFLALVSSAKKVEELEPLPNIDFNIMAGNSLIGLLSVEGEKFNSLGITGDIFRDNEAQSYTQILNEKNRLIASYKDSSSYSDNLTSLRDLISDNRTKNYKKLNRLLLTEFERLQIKYEQATWDEAKNKLGKPIKRALTMVDINSLQPFHWGYEFDAIFARGGFDAIITNPPWEIFQATEKEFFDAYPDISIKKMMNVFEFIEKRNEFLKDEKIRNDWEKYCSFYTHQNAYFKKHEQYKNQISYIDNKIVPSKNNLYKLFVELSYRLLSPSGYCGIIIPNSFYMDAATKQLRELLFNTTQINDLFGLANERFIFEGVDHRFRFCIMTYQKGKITENINVAFRNDPREAIKPENLESFLKNEHLIIPISLIKKISPDTLAIDELKSQADIDISLKLFNFPIIKERIKNKWNIDFTTEFDKKACRDLFETEKNNNNYPMYSGSMFHHFNHRFSEAVYYINCEKGKSRVLNKKSKIFSGKFYRLLMRRISSPTNERSLISTIVPPISFCDNSVNYVIPEGYKPEELVFICAIFNSYVFDFIVRSKLNNNITIGLINSLPIPRLSEKDPQFKAIVARAAALICTTPEFDELRAELDLSGFENLKGLDEVSRGQHRAELDAMIAHLYGLTEDEFAHILATFPIVKEDVKAAALAAFNRLMDSSSIP